MCVSICESSEDDVGTCTSGAILCVIRSAGTQQRLILLPFEDKCRSCHMRWSNVPSSCQQAVTGSGMATSGRKHLRAKGVSPALLLPWFRKAGTVRVTHDLWRTRKPLKWILMTLARLPPSTLPRTASLLLANYSPGPTHKDNAVSRLCIFCNAPSYKANFCFC